MSQPQAGWYDDPDNPSAQRWWDGQAWSDQRRETPAVPPPPPIPPAAPPVQPVMVSGGGSDKRLEHALLPTDRSGLAIAAGYLGLFAGIIFPAPIALVVGLLALRDLGRNPEKLGRGRAWFGTIMGGIVTLVFGVAIAMG